VSKELSTWNAWLNIIFKDVQRLLIQQQIYAEVRAIINANKSIQEGSSFYGWMNDVYIDSMVIGVRRQVDMDRRTVSLVRLLDGIAHKPGAVTRQGYISLIRDHCRGKGVDNLAQLKVSLANK
jgi:hypothetical protein